MSGVRPAGRGSGYGAYGMRDYARQTPYVKDEAINALLGRAPRLQQSEDLTLHIRQSLLPFVQQEAHTLINFEFAEATEARANTNKSATVQMLVESCLGISRDNKQIALPKIATVFQRENKLTRYTNSFYAWAKDMKAMPDPKPTAAVAELCLNKRDEHFMLVVRKLLIQIRAEIQTLENSRGRISPLTLIKDDNNVSFHISQLPHTLSMEDYVAECTTIWNTPHELHDISIRDCVIDNKAYTMSHERRIEVGAQYRNSLVMDSIIKRARH